MKTVGVIVGTQTSWISDAYFKKNKTKLKYLDSLDDSIKPVDDIPYDYAILCEMKFLESKYKVQVIPLYGPSLTLQDANQCDYIYCIYEGVFSFMDGGMDAYTQYMNVLSKTTALVEPSVQVQKFIINKQRYMNWLKKHKFDIIPTLFVKLSSYQAQKKKTLESILTFENKSKYSSLIMKPELGAFAGGLKIFKRHTLKSYDSYLQSLVKRNYQKVLVQPYIPEFSKFYEIKTYWLSGNYLYSYGIDVLGYKDDDYPESEGGSIPEDYIDQCKQTGKRLIRLLFKEFGTLPEVRIDFGCCIDNDNLCRDYFVNEIEIIPTKLDDETKLDNFRLLAETILKRV